MRLFPQRYEKPLFDLFGDIAQLLVAGAETLSRALGESPRERPRIASQLHEQAGDAAAVTRRITNRLAAALITPFEAEVLHALALTLSDALATMERTADLTVRLKLGSIPDPLLETAELITRAAELTVESMWRLGDIAALQEYTAAMHRLDNHAERLFRGALADILAGTSAADMLRMREVAVQLRAVMELFERAGRETDLLRIKDS